jgi:hypothetical protein
VITTEELVNKLECFKGVLIENIPLGLAAASAHAEKCERIFTKGLNSNGGRIGQYNDSNSLYINPNDKKRSPIKTTPIGKNGDTVFKSTGKPHLTTYFKSYKDFREKIGREGGFINLVLFGNLKINFENNSRGNGPEPVKVNANEYHTGLDNENSLKKSGAEKRFGDIFDHTKGEIDTFHRVVGLELKNAFSKC